MAAPTSPGACAGWEISARDRNTCVVHTGEQQCLFPSYTSCQAAKRSEFYTGWGQHLGNLWHYETDQVRVPESVQEAAPRFSHFSSHFRGNFFSSHSRRACPQHWVEPSLEHVSDMALLLTNHPENLGVPPWRFGCRKNMPPGDKSHAEPVTNWPFATTSGDVTLSDAPEGCHGTTPMRQAHPTGTKSLLP